MDERNDHMILEEMDAGLAFFHLLMDENGKVTSAVIEACNRHYLDVSESVGLPRDKILHHSYYELMPEPDPRWEYYMYRAAVLREHVHGGFRNREFHTWMEFSGGPAVEDNTCWMMFIDHTDFKDENEKLEKERSIDALTGVNNRNAYEDALTSLRSCGNSAGVIMVDINGLKEINDTRGHKEGDRLIEKTASLLGGIMTDHLPYRIGGDEFVLLFSPCRKEEIESYAFKIHALKTISLSCGYAWCRDGKNIDEAIKEADKMMYDDKRKYYRTHSRKHVH